MDMKQTRRLKIVKSISPKLSPLLPLKGNLLAQAGFTTGMYVGDSTGTMPGYPAIQP